MKFFSGTRASTKLLGLLAAVLLLWQSPAIAQQTTGTVSGVVKDASGAIIPHATVVLTNLDNKTERTSVTNSAGDFTMASVTSALQYHVTVSSPGFRTWQSKPFAVRPGDQIGFTDIKLAVGEVSAQVTVEAGESQEIKPLDSPERSDVITAKDLDTLAIQGRDATELIRILPGFALVSPGLNNQAPQNDVVGVSNSNTGNFSSNGTGTTGIATILDGVSLTDIQNNSATTQTMNAEMVQDIKVSTSSFSSEYAHGPTVITGVTKQGQSGYHGSAYLYVRNAAMNANDWYNNYLKQTRPDQRYFFPGGTLGGPLWIPHTRFSRTNSKLFFFAGYENYNQLFSPSTLGSWVPTMAQRNGDFSVASLNAQLCGARPDGAVNQNAVKTMCNGENYLPDGTSVNNGNLVGKGNASGIALMNWLPLPNADPFSNAAGYNYIQTVLQHQNGSMFHARVDYVVNDNNRISATYGRQAEVTENPVAYGYSPGAVTTGAISNIVSATYTRVFTSALVNELTAAVSLISDPGNEGNPAAVGRFTMNGYNCNDPVARAAGTCGAAGKGNFSYLGEFKNAGDYSVPQLLDYNNGGGGLGYPNVQMSGGFYNNQIHLKKEVPDFQDAISWTKRSHNVKLGVYYEKGIINGTAVAGYPQGAYTFNPQSSYFDYNSQVGQAAQFTGCENPNPAGNARTSGAAYLGACMTPNALMYLGYADTFQQTNFTPIVNMQYTTFAGFVNDSWRIHRVTLQLGARIEHLGPWFDRHGNGLATFQSALYKTQCVGRACSSVNGPGLAWHGIDSTVSNSVNSPAKVYLSPRLGLAWDVFGKSNTVLRGGWGIYRHEEEFQPYALAASTAQGYKTTFQQGTQTFDAIDRQSPTNPQDFSVYTIDPNDTVRPVYYEYNATISQRIGWHRLHSLVEVAYVGTNSQHVSTYNNQASGYNGASDLNLIPAGYLFGTSATDPGCICNLTTGGLTSADSMASLTTPQTDFFRPYSFYQHVYSLHHNYYGNYNSLQVSWNKNSGPITFGANYTFSKNLATAASYNNVLPDPVNLRNDYNPVPYDRTHVFNVHYLVDIGKRYKGDHHLLAAAANGWQISGISSVQSGIPLASAQGQNFGFGYGQIQPVQVSTKFQLSPNAIPACQSVYGIPADKNGDHFCVTNLNPVVWLGTPDYQLQPTVLCDPTSGLKTNQFINPTCFGIPIAGGPTTGTYATSTNPSGQGQYRLPYIHGPAYARHDLTVLKNFYMGEKRNLQLRAAAFNFLNHPLTSFNNSDTSNLTLALQGATAGKALTVPNLTNQNFGIANVKYGARAVELSAKFQF